MCEKLKWKTHLDVMHDIFLMSTDARIQKDYKQLKKRVNKRTNGQCTKVNMVFMFAVVTRTFRARREVRLETRSNSLLSICSHFLTEPKVNRNEILKYEMLY